MKWDWGKGIALSFVLFCSFIVWIVVQAFQEDFSLVSETYYQDELVYQQHIDQQNNLESSGLAVLINQSKEAVLLEFPEAFSTAKGKIHFYHPSKDIFDRSYPITLDENRLQSIDKRDLVKGRFKVKMTWESSDKGYYQEQEVFLR